MWGKGAQVINQRGYMNTTIPAVWDVNTNDGYILNQVIYSEKYSYSLTGRIKNTSL